MFRSIASNTSCPASRPLLQLGGAAGVHRAGIDAGREETSVTGRIRFVPDARADGANGACEIVCPPPDGSIQVCNSDPADPDCNLTINTTCLCNDGSTFTITGSPSPTTCNTDTTCNGHDGWAGAGGKCLCNDGYSFDSPFTPSSAACTPNPPTSPSCFDHGGWAGDPITIGGCAGLEIFTRCTADAFVHDPSTSATLVNERLVAAEALGHLETQAIDEVIALHGLSTSTEERARVLIWARDRVRAQIFAKLVNSPQRVFRRAINPLRRPRTSSSASA